MICPYCKTENDDSSQFCNNCGLQLNPSPASAMSTSGTSTTMTGAGGVSGNSRSLTPGSRLQGGRYVVKKVLGTGGMGAALLATDIRLDSKPVVIKELISDSTDPQKMQEDVRNFKREVATLAHIDHPLVPNVTDHFQEGTRYFMVQEYVEGENLDERMDRVNQPMKEQEALSYASEMLDVLDYLSQQTPPIVHRDIKPANIIINARNKRAYLVDFGIARADVSNARRKQTAALGTPGYAPPEQYQGNADPRSDLYALAATLHHVLTNRDPRNHPPFSYPPVRQLNPALSPEIERVLTKALNNDINSRYQSASAMKRDIDNILMNRFGMAGYMAGVSGPMPAISNTSSNAPTFINRAPNAAGQRSQQQAQRYPAAASTLSGTPPRSIQQGQRSGGQGRGYIAPPPNPPGSKRNRNGLGLLALLLVVILIGAALLLPNLLTRLRPTTGGNATATPTKTAVPTLPPFAPNGIGTTTAADGELIGISDGTAAFYTALGDANLKQQASAKLQAGDTVSANTLWNSALNMSSNDAEALIYKEDLRIASSPHITMVIATMLTGTNSNVGLDDLQGAYVAQKFYNDNSKLPGGMKLRLLVANSGDVKEYARNVAQQIVKVAQNDPTFVGVMGWPFSSNTLEAVGTLNSAHIPMVSSTASSDELTGTSPYFFRVAASNKEQGIDGAQYAENTLHAKNVALFVDPSDAYSASLAIDFSNQFTKDGNKIVATENYTVGEKGHADLPKLLTDALSKNPDLIYFSGYASDISTLLSNFPSDGSAGNLPVLGGDALYELGGYNSSSRANFSRLHFTAFAYPDEWSYQGQKNPDFFTQYATAFDPNQQHSAGTYDFNRPSNDTILSYDAMLALLNASSTALTANSHLTSNALQQALIKTTFQGISGQVAFDSNGDPINKAIVVLRVDAQGHILLESIQGKFFK